MKKILSFVVCVCMLLALFPAAVFADEAGSVMNIEDSDVLCEHTFNSGCYITTEEGHYNECDNCDYYDPDTFENHTYESEYYYASDDGHCLLCDTCFESDNNMVPHIDANGNLKCDICDYLVVGATITTQDGTVLNRHDWLTDGDTLTVSFANYDGEATYEWRVTGSNNEDIIVSETNTYTVKSSDFSYYPSIMLMIFVDDDYLIYEFYCEGEETDEVLIPLYMQLKAVDGEGSEVDGTLDVLIGNHWVDTDETNYVELAAGEYTLDRWDLIPSGYAEPDYEITFTLDEEGNIIITGDHGAVEVVDGVTYIIVTLSPEVTEVPIEAPVAYWNISLYDNIALNLYFNVTKDQIGSATASVNGEDVDLSALPRSENDNPCLCIKLAARQMTEEITVSLTTGDTTYVETYSILKYANIILGGDYDEYTKALVKDMLNYGGMAQKYTGYRTDNLANDGITDAGQTDIPELADEYSVDGEIDGITAHAASLVLRNRVTLRFYFSGNITGLTFAANGKEFTPVEQNGMYFVEYTDILPQYLDNQITMTVTDAEGNTLSVTYGPLNYIVNMKQKGSDTIKDLLRALYNYHLAAQNYVAE